MATLIKQKPADRPAPAWIFYLGLVLALGFIAATCALRIQRIVEVSAHAGLPAKREPAVNAEWSPRIVIPGNLASSYQWLDQTREMLVTGQLRIRHIDYENAPVGHDIRAPFPYRCWLGGLAWIFHLMTGQAIYPSLENAALMADPLLHVFLIALTSGFVFWRFGLTAGVLVSMALAALYPLSVTFLPGAPSDEGLVLLLGLGSILCFAAGVEAPSSPRLWMVSSGVFGGFGMWMDVTTIGPILLGLAMGAVWGACMMRQRTSNPATNIRPWRLWALSGAAVILAAYLAEYFPSHLGAWDLKAVHPIYGIAWLGLGELMGLAIPFIRAEKTAGTKRDWGVAILAMAAFASLFVVAALTHRAESITDIANFRLTRLAGGVASNHVWAWLVHDGFSPIFLGTTLPVLLLGPALWLVFRRNAGRLSRELVVVTLGPVVVTLCLGCIWLSWWKAFDITLIALLAAVTAAARSEGRILLFRWMWPALVAVPVLVGALQTWPRLGSAGAGSLDSSEVEALIERDLARWLIQHAPPGGVVVLAPAKMTTALHYYGRHRGIGTMDLQNIEGLQATVRIVSATTFDEALTLIDNRGVNYIVIPSWDDQLYAFANLGLGKVEGSFIDGLHRLAVPPWLRPVTYPLPRIDGFEDQSVVVLKRVENQSDPLLISRIAEYLVETENLIQAASAAEMLRRYRTDLSALVARAEVQIARGEAAAYADTLGSILTRLSENKVKTLPFDRRISLAVVLAQGRHLDLARVELEKCLAEVTDERLRSLTTGSLYHLLVLAKALNEEIKDPRLHQLALDLLPLEYAKRLTH
jgi:hypothetical protein